MPSATGSTSIASADAGEATGRHWRSANTGSTRKADPGLQRVLELRSGAAARALARVERDGEGQRDAGQRRVHARLQHADPEHDAQHR